MSKDYFVSKFMAGTSGSQRMNWWHRHAAGSSAYLQKWSTPESVVDRKILTDTMKKSCQEWSALVCPKDVLMLEHAMLEFALVDATMSIDFNRNRLMAITDFMSQNAAKQADFFGSKIHEFPVNQFRDLMLEHVKLFVESVRWYATPDDKKYAACEERRMRNTLALASFSTEWL